MTDAVRAAPRSVTLLYFAGIREAVGVSQESLDLPEGILNVGQLSAFLERVKPALSGRLASVRLAVNEVFASDATPIAAGDVIALIPPVSGG